MARGIGGRLSLVIEQDGQVEEVQLKEFTVGKPKIEVYADDWDSATINVPVEAYKFDIVSYDLDLPKKLIDFLNVVYPTTLPHITNPTASPLAVKLGLGIVLVLLTIIVSLTG